jgi:hypothetical protein
MILDTTKKNRMANTGYNGNTVTLPAGNTDITAE